LIWACDFSCLLATHSHYSIWWIMAINN